jgi:hypothetical protein
MVSSLQCNVKSTNEDQYKATFDYICAADSKFCNGIAHNATTGTYGGYSGCDPKDQLAFVANQYYLGNNKRSDACSFGGMATIQTAQTASSCVSLLSAVGANGSGTPPSATARGSGAAGSSSGSKGAAASTYSPAFFAHGGVAMTAWIVVALGSLIGMLVL